MHIFTKWATQLTLLGLMALCSTVPIKGADKIVQTDEMYTYEEMCADIGAMTREYEDLVSTGTIGQSVMGDDIPYIAIGNQQAQHNVLIQAGIHGREYHASQVVMKIAEYYLSQKPEVLDDTRFWIVPMANPDGIGIAQYGSEYCKNAALAKFVAETGHQDEWKANAEGVDLNRNFAVGWQDADLVQHRAYAYYRGDTPASEPETRALMAFALARPYDAFLSYHTQGEVVYYDEVQNTPENSKRSTRLAEIISRMTGYEMHDFTKEIREKGLTQRGGFNDWAQVVCDRPGVTIELGTSPEIHDMQSQVFMMYIDNRDTWGVVSEMFE